jgi:hypothetical protein
MALPAFQGRICGAEDLSKPNLLHGCVVHPPVDLPSAEFKIFRAAERGLNQVSRNFGFYLFCTSRRAVVITENVRMHDHWRNLMSRDLERIESQWANGDYSLRCACIADGVARHGLVALFPDPKYFQASAEIKFGNRIWSALSSFSHGKSEPIAACDEVDGGLLLLRCRLGFGLFENRTCDAGFLAQLWGIRSASDPSSARRIPTSGIPLGDELCTPCEGGEKGPVSSNNVSVRWVLPAVPIWEKLVGRPAGIEPATSCATDRRSATELRPPH